MGESKHTEGPWVWVGGQLLARRKRHSETILVTTDPFDPSEGDARLIAAAPDLLAALKMAQIWLDVDGRFDMAGINAAIAKATGAEGK